MAITYTDNSKKMIRWLKRVHGGLAITSANTLNEAASNVEKKYKKTLKMKFKLRAAKFTLGAVMIFKATAKRTSGEMRKISGINAIVGVRKMRGGKEHYLAKQEFGDVSTGKSITKGKVPFPIVASRTAGESIKPIAGISRLKRNPTQTLKLGGSRFGFKDKFNARGQRWAILWKYTGRSGYGSKKRGRKIKKYIGKQGWDLKKPFFFTGQDRGFGIFQLKKSRIQMIRILNRPAIRIKERNLFGKSVDQLTPQVMERLFLKNAKKFVTGK